MARQELFADQSITTTQELGGNVRVPADTVGANVFLQPQIPLPYGDGGFRLSINYRANNGSPWIPLGSAEVGPDDSFPDRNGVPNPRLVLGITVPDTDQRLNRAFVQVVIEPVPDGVARRIGLDFDTY